MQKEIPYKILTLIIIILNLYSSSYASRTKSSQSAGVLRTVEKGLKDNRYFFFYINSSVSNLGTEEEKNLYKEAIQRDIIAQLLYMKFLFKDSFLEIRKAQKVLVNLYRITLKKDISRAKKLLDDFAPGVIKSNDKKARHYLWLGYRDIIVSKRYLLIADNYREKLYSLRLYKYVTALKKTKTGKRYAFLSTIESKVPQENKKMRHLNFIELEKRISSIYPDKISYYKLIHLDNYYKYQNEKSFFDKIWENPNLKEIEEFEEYLKKQ